MDKAESHLDAKNRLSRPENTKRNETRLENDLYVLTTGTFPSPCVLTNRSNWAIDSKGESIPEMTAGFLWPTLICDEQDYSAEFSFQEVIRRKFLISHKTVYGQQSRLLLVGGHLGPPGGISAIFFSIPCDSGDPASFG